MRHEKLLKARPRVVTKRRLATAKRVLRKEREQQGRMNQQLCSNHEPTAI